MNFAGHLPGNRFPARANSNINHLTYSNLHERKEPEGTLQVPFFVVDSTVETTSLC
jgi:hypothetical protein